MALKLAIGNTIGVKVEGSTRDENGNDKPFKFTLICDRLTADQLKETMADKDESVSNFFEKRARDWRNQDLVLDEDGKPAPFSLPALQVLFTISGMAGTCWQAYLTQVVATGKN